MAIGAQNEEITKRYDIQKWAEQTKVGKHIFIWKYFMRGKEIPGWELVKTIPEQIYKERRIFTYMWQKAETNTEDLAKIDIVESHSWHAAHETLLELLVEEHQALELPVPEATAQKIELGDVAYTGFGETVQSAIFTRANMVVRINSVGKQNVSIIDIADQVDKLFISKPQLSEEGVIPEIELFSSEKMSIKREERVVLDIRAKDPLGRPLWYKFMTEQGEVFVDDEKVWFSSKTLGQPEISLFTINENNFVAGATLSIRVE